MGGRWTDSAGAAGNGLYLLSHSSLPVTGQEKKTACILSLLVYVPLIYYILTRVSPPSHLPKSLFSAISTPLHFLSEKSWPPRDINQTPIHGIAIFNKTRHTISHQGWRRQPRKEEKGLTSRQKSQTAPDPLLAMPQE